MDSQRVLSQKIFSCCVGIFVPSVETLVGLGSDCDPVDIGFCIGIPVEVLVEAPLEVLVEVFVSVLRAHPTKIHRVNRITIGENDILFIRIDRLKVRTLIEYMIIMRKSIALIIFKTLIAFFILDLTIEILVFTSYDPTYKKSIFFCSIVFLDKLPVFSLDQTVRNTF